MEELKVKIREELFQIPVEILRRTTQNITKRLDDCLRRDGIHRKEIVLKVVVFDGDVIKK